MPADESAGRLSRRRSRRFPGGAYLGADPALAAEKRAKFPDDPGCYGTARGPRLGRQSQLQGRPPALGQAGHAVAPAAHATSITWIRCKRAPPPRKWPSCPEICSFSGMAPAATAIWQRLPRSSPRSTWSSPPILALPIWPGDWPSPSGFCCLISPTGAGCSRRKPPPGIRQPGSSASSAPGDWAGVLERVIGKLNDLSAIESSRATRPERQNRQNSQLIHG